MWHRELSKIVESSSLFEASTLIVLTFSIIALFYILYYRSNKNEKLPPGPTGIPVFGYYLFLGKEPEKSLNELGKKYGNVIG